jgi:hypothetical protein
MDVQLERLGLLVAAEFACAVAKKARSSDDPITRSPDDSVLQRHHHVTALAERCHSFQAAASTGQRHDWTVAEDCVAGSCKVPFAAFAWGGFGLVGEMRRRLGAWSQVRRHLWDGE